MNDDQIKCPWCGEPRMEDTIYPEGIRKCGRCKKMFEFQRHTEVTFTTRKIEYVK